MEPRRGRLQAVTDHVAGRGANLVARQLLHQNLPEEKEIHGGLSQHHVEQLSIRQLASEALEDVVESYHKEEYSSWANLHKAIPPEFTPTGFFRDVVEKTEKEGSVKGLSLFKQRLKDYLL